MAEDEYDELDESDPDTSEQNVYKNETRERLVENDEISPEEEGFMSGYDDEGSDEDEEDN